MKSTQLFDAPPPSGRSSRSKRSVRPRAPVLPTLLLSLCVPGGGHLLLGQARTAVALFGVGVSALAASVAARGYGLEPLGFELGRIALWCWLYSAVDGPWQTLQTRPARRRSTLPPRRAALEAALAYGLPWGRMGARGLAVLVTVVGGGAHAALLMRGGPVAWFAEIIPAFLAFWAFRRAEEEELLATEVRTELGELSADAPPASPRPPVAPTPDWLRPVILASALLVLGGGIALRVATSTWLDQRNVDIRQSLAVEPYYRNARYGVSLEMHSPGWSFRETLPDRFVFAQHLAENARVWLGLRPRIPGFDHDGPALLREMERAAAEGYVLQVDGESPIALGGLDGHELRAHGRHGNQTLEIRVATAAHGWRRYVLWGEWSVPHADFGRREWSALLAALGLEGHIPRAEAATGTFAR